MRGYGRAWFDGKEVYAHRLIAFLLVGRDLHSKFQTRHICNNKACVRPDPKHTVRGTAKENGQDRINSRSSCNQGHELTPDNTIYDNGYRRCRICLKAKLNALKERRELAKKFGV